MATSIITYAQPWYAYCAIAALLGSVLMLWYALQMRSAVQRLSSSQNRSYMVPGFSWIKVVVRSLLVISALWALCFALLRPQRESDAAESRHEYGRDVVIAVDISRSMLVEDCSGQSRLAVARKKIMDLARYCSSERIALVVFSGSAMVQCPLTKDMSAFQLFVEALDTEVLSGSGTTSLSAAVDVAQQVFQQCSGNTNKLLIMVTDGEDFSADAAVMKDIARRSGLLISVMGIGSVEGGPIPLYDAHKRRTGHQRDAKGAVVISRLNESLASSLAQQCKGLYCRVDNEGVRDIEELLRWVRAREAEKGSLVEVAGREDLFMIGTGWAFGALVAAWCL